MEPHKNKRNNFLPFLNCLKIDLFGKKKWSKNVSYRYTESNERAVLKEYGRDSFKKLKIYNTKLKDNF